MPMEMLDAVKVLNDDAAAVVAWAIMLEGRLHQIEEIARRALIEL